jgi:hypothetical protein
MAGLFNSPHASNYKASNVWDVVPSDVVANVILAAAAALGQGSASRCCVSPTRIYPQHQEHLEVVAQSARAQAQHSGQSEPLLIVHCGSSTTYPLTIMESWNWGVEVYGACECVLVYCCCGCLLNGSVTQALRRLGTALFVG